MNTNVVKSFVKEFLAIVTGDEQQAQAEKSFRYANSALSGQISKLEGDVITKEEALKDAQDHAEKALWNHGKPITPEGRDRYVSDLVDSENKVKVAQKALDEHNSTISFLKGKLEKINSDVKA